jgi:hypothetical protein
MYADDEPYFFDPDELPRVIGRAEALRRGLSWHAVDRRVASGRWRRVLPRTYLTAEAVSWAASRRERAISGRSGGDDAAS